MVDIYTDKVLGEVLGERARQDDKWGEQNHPDGTENTAHTRLVRETARIRCDERHRIGVGTWRDILSEEVYEAYAEEPGSPGLRNELVQCAAVIVAWIEAIDRREP